MAKMAKAKANAKAVRRCKNPAATVASGGGHYLVCANKSGAPSVVKFNLARSNAAKARAAEKKAQVAARAASAAAYEAAEKVTEAQPYTLDGYRRKTRKARRSRRSRR